MAIFVVSVGAGDGDDLDRPLDFPGEAVALGPRLFVCTTDASQSRLYHAVKKQLADGTPLFVGELAGRPKFMGMTDGSTKAVRGLFGDG